MIKDIKYNKEKRINTCVYVDYENVTKQLKSYGVTPAGINFFQEIRSHLERMNLNIVDFCVYANYDDGEFTKGRCQTELQALGLQTRHTSNKGKNAGDLEMTVDALRVLYKNDYIEAFVIISCDRDFIPLIKAIKSENKIAYVISTQVGFNSIVATYADAHEYIEKIFKSEIDKSKIANEVVVKSLENETIDFRSIQKICKLFYGSNAYTNLRDGKSAEIILSKYSTNISRMLKITPKEVKELFNKASELEYICIYKNENKANCLKEGKNKDEILLMSC